MILLSTLMTCSRTTEIFSAAQKMINEYDSGEWSEETKLTRIFYELKTANMKLERAIDLHQALSNFEEKDEIRDDKVHDIYYLITGYLHSPDANIRAAAEKVDCIFVRYANRIKEDNYCTEKGFITSLLIDLEDAELNHSISLLPGLNKLIMQLKSAEENYKRAKFAYEKDSAIEWNEENATLIKRKVAEIINSKLVVYLRAMNTMDEAKYGDITMTISRIIDEINTIVNKRRKKSTSVVDTVQA